MTEEVLKKNKETPFFFIIGRPRSGTTLLRTMLDAHPNVRIPLENSKLVQLQKKYSIVKTWGQKELDAFYEDFFRSYLKTMWRIDEKRIKERFTLIKNQQASFDTLIKICYSEYLSAFPKEEIKIIGDKSPINSLYQKKLYYGSFKNARYIFLTRDPRDNIISIQNKGKNNWTKPILAHYWSESVRQYLHLTRKASAQIIHVKYEDLLLHTEKELQRICNFLSIPYSERMLEFYTRKEAYPDNYIKKWESTLFKPINKSHTDLWKTQMSAADIKKVEYHCGKMLDIIKYEKTHKAFSVSYHLSRIPSFVGIFFHEMFRHIFEILPAAIKRKIAKRKKRIFIETRKESVKK